MKRIVKKLIGLIVIIAILISFSKMANYRPIAESLIAVGANLSCQKDKIYLDIEIQNNKDNFILVKGEGNSVRECINFIEKDNGKNLVLKNIRIIYIDESIQNEILEEIIKYNLIDLNVTVTNKKMQIVDNAKESITEKEYLKIKKSDHAVTLQEIVANLL